MSRVIRSVERRATRRSCSTVRCRAESGARPVLAGRWVRAALREAGVGQGGHDACCACAVAGKTLCLIGGIALVTLSRVRNARRGIRLVDAALRALRVESASAS